MIISFTQTYSNNRFKLLEYQMRDENLIKFKNMLDLNLFSFHDCKPEIIEKFKAINRVKNTQILTFNDVPYTFCIKSLLEFVECLKSSEKYLFFIQDDGFSINSIDYESLLKSLKPETFVSLGFCQSDFTKQKSVYLPVDFHENGYFSIDDSPYIADFNIIKQLYDDDYISKNNVWAAEMHLSKVNRHKAIEKTVLSVTSFKNINILGCSSFNANVKGMISGQSAINLINKKFNYE